MRVNDCSIKVFDVIVLRGPKKKTGCVQTEEYIDRNNKVVIFMHVLLRNVLSEWHLVLGGHISNMKKST